MLFAELEEIEGVFVLDGKFRLRAKRGRERPIEVGLAEQGLLVALILDLMDQDVLDQPNF